jgi:hypothetical protein
MATYKLNRAAFREELLNADWMVAHMAGIAERAREIAVETAPFDPADPDGQHYKERFTVSSGKQGGIHHDRAYGRLENDDTTPDGFNVAAAVEFGNSRTPAHHTVYNAVEAAASE